MFGSSLIGRPTSLECNSVAWDDPFIRADWVVLLAHAAKLREVFPLVKPQV